MSRVSTTILLSPNLADIATELYCFPERLYTARLISVRLAVNIELCLVYGYRIFRTVSLLIKVPQIARRMHHTYMHHTNWPGINSQGPIFYFFLHF